MISRPRLITGLAIAAVAALLAVGLLPGSGPAPLEAQGASGQREPIDARLLTIVPGGKPVLPQHNPKLHPKLESQLSRLVEEYRSGGLATAQEQARLLGADLEGQRVRVIVHAQPHQAAQSAAAARTLGCRVEATYGDLVQVLAPLGMLEALADKQPVRFVRLPLRAEPAVVTGQGVGLINADNWQAAGIDGSGLKVAVLDGGFTGYAALLGTELPASVVTHSCSGDITGGGIVHGTAVAEIVHEVAPGAELYLVNFDTEVELGNCVDWLIAQGVDVINASWGFFGSGPGDGTGVINEIADTATSAGIFWANASGNHTARHWSGVWSDPDGNGWHNYNAVDEGNTFYATAGVPLLAILKWDDPFGASCNDYDLLLYRSAAPPPAYPVAGFTSYQTCTQDPVEGFVFTPSTDESYDLFIKRYSATRDVNFHLYLSPYSLQYRVAAGSLLEPADNPDVMTVGAVDWATPNTIESFSSQGPTSDGRKKPDIVAPDDVSSETYSGGFSGTSASSPHVAGAAALVWQLNPCFSRTAVQSFLEGRAVDLGPSGKDNVYGSGRLDLGSPTGPELVGDFDGDGNDDAANYDPACGQWWVNRSTGSSFVPELWATFSTKTGWGPQLVGDFNGDLKDDVVSYHAASGRWWVNVSDGSKFTPQLWATFSTKTGWTAQLAGDFTGDDRDDVVNYHPASGTWWVNVSDGAKFTPQKWTTFSTKTGWTAQLVGNFDGDVDGRDDVVNYHPASGTWWVNVSKAAPDRFEPQKWTTFSTKTGWTAQLAGDFTGDLKDDVVNYHAASGRWWVNVSTGSDSFQPQWWATFSTKTGWTAQLAGDFTGDGRDDVVNYHPASGTWWVNVSKAAPDRFEPQKWATFSTKTGWDPQLVGDFNDDDMDDVVNYHAASGRWWVNVSTGSDSFQPQWWL